MFTRGRSITIKASPEAVFDYVSDLTRHGEWSAQPMKIAVNGPLQPGTTYTSGAHFMGSIPGKGQILEADRPRRFTFDAADSSGHYKWYFNITPEGDGVRLDYGFERLSAPLPFLLLQGVFFWPVFGNKWAGQSLERIKAKVEAGAA